jgi:hypothetical protein
MLMIFTLSSCAESIGNMSQVNAQHESGEPNSSSAFRIIRYDLRDTDVFLGNRSIALLGMSLQDSSKCEGESCLGEPITLHSHELDMLVQMNCSDENKLREQLMLKSLRQACFSASGDRLEINATTQSLNSRCPAEKGCLTQIVVTRKGSGFRLGSSITPGNPSDSESTGLDGKDSKSQPPAPSPREISLSLNFSTVKPKTLKQETCKSFKDMLQDPNFEVYRRGANELVSAVCKGRRSR